MFDVEYTKVAGIGAILVLLLALANMPYGYYLFLRIIVSIVGVMFVIVQNDPKWRIAFLFIIVLYNPIILISLGRDAWKIIDIIVAVIFGYNILILLNDQKNRNREQS